MALVVMDRNEYIRKMKKLLDDTNTYKLLNTGHAMKTKEQVDQHPKKSQHRSKIRRQHIQKNVSNWSLFTQTIWASQNMQEEHPPDAHCCKLGLCDVWGSKGIGQNPETLDW